MPASKKIILTEKAPQPIGPYSQAVQVGEFLFCSGQVALDPVTGQMSGSDIESQTHQVLKNIQALLGAANIDLASVVKTTIFLKSMNDFPRVNEIYGSYFKTEPPARSTFEVSRLPRDAMIEIEVIATVKA
jgi:2-iminobutanoate/2-iminopropanoate deaminase